MVVFWIDDLPMNIPRALVAPPKMKVVLFEVKKIMGKATTEKISLIMPIRTATIRGSKLIPALSRNGAV